MRHLIGLLRSYSHAWRRQSNAHTFSRLPYFGATMTARWIPQQRRSFTIKTSVARRCNSLSALQAASRSPMMFMPIYDNLQTSSHGNSSMISLRKPPAAPYHIPRHLSGANSRLSIVKPSSTLKKSKLFFVCAARIGRLTA